MPGIFAGKIQMYIEFNYKTGNYLKIIRMFFWLFEDI